MRPAEISTHKNDRCNYILTSTQCHLGVPRHSITLVKYNQLELVVENRTSASKVLDFISDNINTAIVRCIQLQCHASNRAPIDLTSQCQYGRSLSGPWGSIKEQMGKLVFVE